MTDSQLKDLADTAGCHWVTLYKWRGGTTYFPQLHKIVDVAAALGYRLTLESTRRRPSIRRVK